MTLLLDTNILLDALQERSPFDNEAKDILKRAQEGEFKCLFTANAATDIFYIYSKSRDVALAKAALNFLINQYGIVSVTEDDCKKALNLQIDDFEDALVVACASKANVDYIITRDEKFLKDTSLVKLITPKDFINLLENVDDSISD